MVNDGSRRLRERVGWLGRGARGAAEQPYRNPATVAEGVRGPRGCAIDWGEAQRRWGIVGLRWDIAILANLDERDGCMPKDLRAAINAQARAELQLAGQVLSRRLRAMEKVGLVRHEDISGLPCVRLYFLRPPGRALIAELSGMLRMAQRDGHDLASVAGAAALRAR